MGKKNFIPWRWPFKKRSKHWNRGVWAERWSSIWLQLKGYHIRERRYKTHVGEIDLIAQRGSLLIAVEVKARPTLREGLESITAKQQQRIQRSMELYLARHEKLHGSDLRFDVVVIKPWSWPKHLTQAWGAY